MKANSISQHGKHIQPVQTQYEAAIQQFMAQFHYISHVF